MREVATKHFLWLMIAWWTGGAWVLYFADAPTLVKELATLQAPFIAYLWIGILTATTYVFAGHAREQVCIYMCPWPRIQAALTDEWALNVTYRRDRGEPRTSIKKAEQLRLRGEPAGDCIDCHQCINVCPTGVDIRNGIQLGCIQCGLCIDACDTVMQQINRPTGLIAYDTDINAERRLAGKPPVYRLIRPRTILYAAIIAVVGGIMLYALATRSSMGISALHERSPLFVTLARRQRPQRLYRALPQQGRRVPLLRAGSARPSCRRDSHLRDRTRRGRQTDRRGRTGPDQGSPGLRAGAGGEAAEGSNRHRVQGCGNRNRPDRLGARPLCSLPGDASRTILTRIRPRSSLEALPIAPPPSAAPMAVSARTPPG